MTQALSHRHPFHIVDPSPWPLLCSISSLTLTSGAVLYMQNYSGGGLTLAFGLVLLISCMLLWWRDVVREATFEGHHTKDVQQGLRYGMILFIVSEVMFFFSFFWAFFHSALAPTVDIGSIWPPKGIVPFDPWEVPLLNTLILLTSGATCTWAHHAIVSGHRRGAIGALFLTLLLAVSFSGLQAMEYIEAPFTISDSIYGSTFYLATGFHGFHVIVGSLFLFVCFIRQIRYHFTKSHHFGFEAAAWYWHFVDVVWLFLFVAIYWWGGA